MSTQIEGFNWGGKRIFFVEAKGKDISFERWRAEFYYAAHLAETVFFQTKEGYYSFIEEAEKHTFSEYEGFRRVCG